jgi:hypothetical protein
MTSLTVFMQVTIISTTREDLANPYSVLLHSCKRLVEQLVGWSWVVKVAGYFVSGSQNCNENGDRFDMYLAGPLVEHLLPQISVRHVDNR